MLTDCISYLQSIPLKEVQRLIQEEVISFTPEESKLYLTYCVYPLFKKNKISLSQLREIVLLLQPNFSINQFVALLTTFM